MKKTKRKIKRRHIFGISAIAFILVSYFIFLCFYSRTYTCFFYLNGVTDISNVRVECSKDDIVKVKDIRMGNFYDIMNILEVDLESTGQGNVTVNIFYDDTYDYTTVPDGSDQPYTKHITDTKSGEISFNVNPFGMIYNLSDDNFKGLWTVRLLTDAIMIIGIIICAISFHERQKNGKFDYSMISLGGIMFFMIVTVIFSLNSNIGSFANRYFLNVEIIIYSLGNIASYFVYATAVPLILFCLLLSISNIQLVRHEGFRINNLLGILLGISVIGSLILMSFLGKDLYSHSEIGRHVRTLIIMSISFIFCYLECLLASTIFCAIASTRYKIKKPMDYIIILGCAIRKDGSPTPILRGRIDRALAFDKEQNEKWNKHAKFVPSGGQGSNEVISEAESMKRYLMEQGIPENCILKEDKSVNTYQNMAFSKKIIEGDAEDISKTNIAFSTTNYHVLRGYTLAQRLGMKVSGLSAKTKKYFYPNAFLREFVGLLVEQKKRHMFFIICGLLVSIALYLIVQY